MIKVQDESVQSAEVMERDTGASSNGKPFDAVKSRILRQIEEDMLSETVNLEDNFAWHGSYIKF